MKEFIEKLIGRLEEEKEAYSDTTYYALGVGSAIKIVNQLEEEYKDNVMINGQYCWQTCGATEHCKECNRLCNGSIDYYENYDVLAEEYNNGWIPVSERLPEERDWYLAVFKEGDSDFVLVPRVADYIGKETVCTTNEGWLIIDLEDEMGINAYYKNLVCIAWQPLPAPYTPPTNSEIPNNWQQQTMNRFERVE